MACDSGRARVSTTRRPGQTRSSPGLDMHESKLIRSLSLKALRKVFESIKMCTYDDSQTLTETEFRAHVHRTSPALDKFARDMYETVRHAGVHKDGDGVEQADFRHLMVAMFGEVAANTLYQTDLEERSKAPRLKRLKSRGRRQAKEDAATVFRTWTGAAADGLLSYEQCKNRLVEMHMPEEDAEDALIALFPRSEGSDTSGCVDVASTTISLEEFTAWYVSSCCY